MPWKRITLLFKVFMLKGSSTLNCSHLYVLGEWLPTLRSRCRPVDMWWHKRRSQISSFDETDEYLNRRGRQLSRLLATEVFASEVVILDTPCSEVVWRVLATHSIRQFPLHFPFRASPCAITFQLDSTSVFIYRFRHSKKIYWRAAEVFLTLKMTVVRSVETLVNLNNRHGLAFHET
jgi:hypothetical protein